MAAYYNEIDPKAAAWLRELIAEGHIAPGEVDERDIRDVKPDDLRPFRQVHLFAGIGGWSAALRKAGWEDDREAWTASCPCQPFSAAGGRSGFADERHLWPAVYHLAGQCRPPVLLGEQVASKDGLAWIDLVSSDMEAAGYAGGALDLCSAGFGAPNIRQRLYFVWLADALPAGRTEGRSEPRQRQIAGRRQLERLAHANGRDASAEGLQRSGEHGQRPQDGGAGGLAHAADLGHERSGASRRRRDGSADDGAVIGLANAGRERRDGEPVCLQPRGQVEEVSETAGRSAISGPGPANGFWRASDWIGCTDGKWRPVAPGSFPLASGIPGRVALLRGAGNAINREVATEFIEAVMAVCAQPERLAA